MINQRFIVRVRLKNVHEVKKLLFDNKYSIIETDDSSPKDSEEYIGITFSRISGFPLYPENLIAGLEIGFNIVKSKYCTSVMTIVSMSNINLFYKDIYIEKMYREDDSFFNCKVQFNNEHELNTIISLSDMDLLKIKRFIWRKNNFTN